MMIMTGQTFLFLKLTLLIGRSLAERCDRMTTQVHEGRFGQSAKFSWLGILHVQLPEDKTRVAMSGIVLIKIKYALAHADDVSRIPEKVFEMDCKVMFMAAHDTPWFTKTKSYVTHPDYDSSTLNTVAIVELNLDDVDDFLLTPICLPDPDTFRGSSNLYLMGFTEGDETLEKVIYKIKTLDKRVCEHFYNRSLVSAQQSQQFTPSAYLCGDAPNTVTQCVWENGMVLVSNVTGYYDLVGFGIHGPGCAAPARFIDLFPYFSWIKSVISSTNDFDEAGHRRKEDPNLIPNAPIHELYAPKDARRYKVLVHHEFERYPFDVDALRFHIIEPTMEDENVLLIIPFNETWKEREESCVKPWVLMYNEYFELRAVPGKVGTVTYKLSLYDREYGTCACVRLTIDSSKREEAVLSFREQINLKENIEMNENSWETPEEIFKYFPVYQRTVKPKHKIKFQNNTLLSERASIKDDDMYPRQVLNYDLYIKFDYKERAIMEFEMFAKRYNTSLGWHFPTTTEPVTPPDMRMPSKITTELPTRRRANSRLKKKPKSRWGMVDWVSNMLKETELIQLADVNEVQETDSGAPSDRAAGAVVVICLLVIMRRVFLYLLVTPRLEV